MSVDKTIRELTKELKAVGAPRDARAAAAAWLLVSLIFVFGILICFFSVRPDLGEVATQFWFLVNLAALAAVFVLASYVGFVSALPGRKAPAGAWFGLQAALIIFFISLTPSLLHLPRPLTSAVQEGLSPMRGTKCGLALLMLGLLPGGSLFFALRRLAPVNPARSARMIGLAMGAMGAFGLGFDCMFANPVHLIVYHGLPIVGLGILGTLLGPRILRW